MNKNFVFYAKEKVFGKSRRLFKHIKNNKIYIIENKEYVPLTKYLKKKYVGGMLDNNVNTKLNLLNSMYEIIMNISKNFDGKIDKKTNDSAKDIINKSKKNFDHYLNRYSNIKIISNIEYIKHVGKYLYYISILNKINDSKKSYIINMKKNSNENDTILMGYIDNLISFKIHYLLQLKIILDKDISSFKPKHVVIKAPPSFKLDHLGIVKFHRLNFDDKRGLLYVTFYDNSNKLISIPIQYVYDADMYKGRLVETMFVGGKKSKK